MIEIEGEYPLDGIKYFHPQDAEYTTTCLHCYKKFTVDIGDGIIEYPQHTQRVELMCPYCEEEFELDVDIKLKYELVAVKVTTEQTLAADTGRCR